MRRLTPGARLLVPLALHVVLFLGVFQMGFTREEVHALVGPGHKLIEPYLVAARQYGPIGVLRTYYYGESDERLYLEYTRLLLTGQADIAYILKAQKTEAKPIPLPERPWPYRDVLVEYPPLALLSFVPPGLFSLEYTSYRQWLAGWFLALHLLNLYLAYRLLRPVFDPKPTSNWPARNPRAADAATLARLLWASLAFTLLLGRLVATRMDHLVVTWTLLCLLAVARTFRETGRHQLQWAAGAGGLAALGVMTKLVPGVAALAAVIVWLRAPLPLAQRLRLIVACSGAVFVVLLTSNLAMYALAGPRYLDTFSYHTLRGVQIESSYSGLLLIAHGFGLPVRVLDAFGSTNLVSSATGWVKLLSPYLLLGGFAWVGLRRWAADARSLTLLTLALLIVFMLTNRVFSPQYLIWIAPPLLALAAFDRSLRPLAVVLLACALLSQLIFPRGYPVLKAFHPLAIALLNLRNFGVLALLLGMVILAREPTSPRSQRG